MKELVFILLGSRKRVGKDTAAAMLEKELRAAGRSVTRLAFAAELKLEVQRMFNAAYEGGLGAPDAFTEDADLKENVVRPVLIAWGCARRHLNPTYLVDKVINTAEQWDIDVSTRNQTTDPYRFVIVSDWRFPNELLRLRERGYIVIGATVERDGVPNTIPEELENSPKCEKLADFFIQNHGDLADLNRKIRTIAQQLDYNAPKST